MALEREYKFLVYNCKRDMMIIENKIIKKNVEKEEKTIT